MVAVCTTGHGRGGCHLTTQSKSGFHIDGDVQCVPPSPVCVRVQVAIKRIVEVFRYEMDTRRFLRELHILRRVKHPNIIHLLDLFVHGTEHDFDELYLVFEVRMTVLARSPEMAHDMRVMCYCAVVFVSTWTRTCRSC